MVQRGTGLAIKRKKSEQIIRNKKSVANSKDKNSTKLKLEIKKSADSIRQKYTTLLSDKKQASEQLIEKWKPISAPIHENLQAELAENFSDVKKSLYDLHKQKVIIKRKPNALKKNKKSRKEMLDDSQWTDQEEEENDDDSAHSKDGDNEESEPREIPKEKRISTGNNLDGKKPTNEVLKYYIGKMKANDTKDIDQIYGVRHDGTKWVIGNSTFNIASDSSVLVDNYLYEGTNGLFHLLFSKNPDMRHVTDEDMKNYKQILLASNAHKKTYAADKTINFNKGTKYMNVIKKLFPPAGQRDTEGSGMNARHHTIEYYDDVNELVDRLRLLTASAISGNNAHGNEIQAILEELREARVIQ